MVLKDKPQKFYANQGWQASFRHALEGICYVLRHEVNFKKHLIIMTVTLVMATALKVTALEWAILLLVCAGVLVAEMINSAIEATVDLIVGSRQVPLAKVAKDIGAGAVLIMAIFAVIIGAVIFLPKLVLLMG